MPKEGMLERFQTVGCLVKAAKNQKGSNQKVFSFRGGCRKSYFNKIESHKK